MSSAVTAERTVENHATSLRRELAVFLMAAAVASLVVLPLAGRGWLLLLDWIPGPHQEISLLHPGTVSGITTSPLQGAVVAMLRGVTSAATAGWLTLAVIITAAGVTMGRFVRGPLRRRIPASMLYMVNPFVYERAFVGQFGLLLAYAALPLVVKAVVECAEGRTRRWTSAALAGSVAIGFAVHAAWILAALLLFTPALVRTSRAAFALIAVAVGVAVTQLYLIVPAAAGLGPAVIGAGDLTAFATRGRGALGVLANVLSLDGFWRVGPTLPRDVLPGWPLLAAALFFTMAVGVWASMHDHSTRRRIAALGAGAATCALLAAGTRGPAAPVFRSLFDHIPGFAVMREPQKFAGGVAFFYAVAFGHGAEHLSAVEGRAMRRVLTLIAALAPVVATPTLLWGFQGQVKPVRVPESWSAADRIVGTGEGKILFLPWHQYPSFPFTGRVTAHPGEAFFRRPVLSGTNAEVPGVAESYSTRSAYLQELFRAGPRLCSFGDLVTPLGVEYVAVTKTLDWERYAWLAQQADLRRTYDSADITIFRNERFRGAAWTATATSALPDLDSVVALSASGGVSLGALTVGVPRFMTDSQEPECEVPPALPPEVDIRRNSPDAFRLSSPGRPVVVADDFDPSWSGGKGRAFAGVGNSTIVRTSPHSRHLVRAGARPARAGLLATMGATAILCLLAVRSWVRTRKHRP